VVTAHRSSSRSPSTYKQLLPTLEPHSRPKDDKLTRGAGGQSRNWHPGHKEITEEETVLGMGPTLPMAGKRKISGKEQAVAMLAVL
jgi:hypothetical protein